MQEIRELKENNRKAEMVGETQFIQPIPDWYEPDKYGAWTALQEISFHFWRKHLAGMQRARTRTSIPLGDGSIRLVPNAIDSLYIRNYLREFTGIAEHNLNKYVAVFAALDDEIVKFELAALRKDEVKEPQAQPKSEQAGEIGDGQTEKRQEWPT